MFSGMMKSKKIIEDKLISNWSKNELQEPASESTWRIGCSCINCNIAREIALQSSTFKLEQRIN